ncbi:MAG: hypothetical protein F7C82_03895 [Desulfurococcales archaeon]|nr:hypothetical protein [Desulfurococcales archaeon]MCE4627133.1 hypothetical protein [Desulfurococcales archaeon]MCE4629400.1 hypothetical protein [Desulfurococcales archaeon]
MRVSRRVLAVFIVLLALVIIGYYVLNLGSCNTYSENLLGDFTINGAGEGRFVRYVQVSGKSNLMNLSVTIKMDSSEHMVVFKVYNGSLDDENLIYETSPGVTISARVGVRNPAKVIYIVVEPATPITDPMTVYRGEMNFTAEWKSCITLFDALFGG